MGFATKAPVATPGTAETSHDALHQSLTLALCCPRDPHSHATSVRTPTYVAAQHRTTSQKHTERCRCVHARNADEEQRRFPTQAHSRLRQTPTRLCRIHASSFPPLTPPCCGAAAWLCARCSSPPSSRQASCSADCCGRHGACQHWPTAVCGSQLPPEQQAEHASCREDDTWRPQAVCAWGVRIQHSCRLMRAESSKILRHAYNKPAVPVAGAAKTRGISCASLARL